MIEMTSFLFVSLANVTAVLDFILPTRNAMHIYPWIIYTTVKKFAVSSVTVKKFNFFSAFI